MNAEVLWLALQAEGYTDITIEQVIHEDENQQAWVKSNEPFTSNPTFVITADGEMARFNSPPAKDFGRWIVCYKDGHWLLTRWTLERIATRIRTWVSL